MANNIVKLTKLKTIRLSRSLVDGLSIYGEPYKGIKGVAEVPTVGMPFNLHNYNCTEVTSIISDTIFRTKNSLYRWEIVKHG